MKQRMCKFVINIFLLMLLSLTAVSCAFTYGAYLDNKQVTGSFVIVEPPPASLEETSWTDIAQFAADGKAQQYFNVGDEKDITLTTGEVITVLILGFEHDDLTGGGKAAITFGMKNCISSARYHSDEGTWWASSEIRNVTLKNYYNQLPLDLKNIIKYVDKKTQTTTSDRLFLFGQVEIDNSSQYKYEGIQYEYWRTVKNGTLPADKIKYLNNGAGSANGWWLRTRYSAGNNFQLITEDGYVGTASPTNTYAISFGFCI